MRRPADPTSDAANTGDDEGRTTAVPPWQGRSRWVQLSTGFDAAGFLALWAAWRTDPLGGTALRHAIVIDAAPPTREHLATLACDAALVPLRDALARAWPPLTPDLHTLVFDAGAVTLMLAVGEVELWLQQLDAQVDAFEIIASAARGVRVFRSLARLAAPQARLTLASPTDDDRRAMRSAGFEAIAGAGVDERPSSDRLQAVHAPRHTVRSARGRRPAESSERHALIVGGGLAGCATAWALAERGWRSTVVDSHVHPAGGASGNPAGLFHGVVHPQDGAHARLHRLAALQVSGEVATAVWDHGVAGSTAGLLRSETRLDRAAMQALLDRLRLPPDYVRAVDAVEASALCGLPRTDPAWLYPAGGWVDPAGLARSYLARAGAACTWIGGLKVAGAVRSDGRWRLQDAAGKVIADSPTLVLANANDAARLAQVDWPLRPVRGQLSWSERAGRDGFALPRIPITGPGYLLPAVGERAIFGASAQPGDPDPTVRTSDHQANLASLAQLLGVAPDIDPEALSGRTAWRCSAPDRLPVIGAVAAGDASEGNPLDRDGLYVFVGLGSRGIGWSALGARVLAAEITGNPSPLPAGLRAAVDPGRFALRRSRRERAATGAGSPAAGD